MSPTKVAAAALAASLVVPLHARAQGEETGAGAPPQTAPAPAPTQAPPPWRRQLPPPQAQPPQAQTAQPTDPGDVAGRHRAALGVMWTYNQLGIRAGDLAASRGSSEQVKSLGLTLANDYRRVESQLGTMLRERTVEPGTLAPSPDKQTLEQELSQLEARTGDDFDKAFVAFLARIQPQFVEAVKRARDATPSKDHNLKKFLDDVENLEEAHLAASRQLKSQRQARTPPAR